MTLLLKWLRHPAFFSGRVLSEYAPSAKGTGSLGENTTGRVNKTATGKASIRTNYRTYAAMKPLP